VCHVCVCAILYGLRPRGFLCNDGAARVIGVVLDICIDRVTAASIAAGTGTSIVATIGIGTLRCCWRGGHVGWCE